MRQKLAEHLSALLDKTPCLGVGIVDANGMLIQTKGEHGGLSPELIGSMLSPTYLDDLAQLTEERFVERMVVGKRYAFFSRWCAENVYMVYAMAPKSAKSVRVRLLLKELAESLEGFTDGDLTTSARERLEQPREFTDGKLIR